MPTATSSISFLMFHSWCSLSTAGEGCHHATLVHLATLLSLFGLSSGFLNSLQDFLGTCLKTTYSISINTPYRGLFVATKLLTSVLL